MRTVNVITTASGVAIPLTSVNSVLEGKGFYVSYNDVDTSPALYGQATTALVFGQMESFYILNGDHRAGYLELIPEGYEACFAYFKANIASINKRSDIPKE
jgi:hypothetical protein